jgi:hypothetical protein
MNKKEEINQDSESSINITTEKIVIEEKNKCGIVMPISSIDGCTAEHWVEVLSILKDAINSSGFEPNLVSDADDSGIIQKRIIHNLYSNEIVVCDVSAKNPNVMFELGMRLAFDKPTIIIKDDKTEYTFDTSIIEHLTYPRDLRFNKIVIFKEALKKKIIATYEKSIKDPNYTTFLKHFGEYKVAHLTEKEVSSEKYIVSAIDELRHEMVMLRRAQKNYTTNRLPSEKAKMNLIYNLIEQYKIENNLENNLDILVENKEEELIKYLENSNEVKDFFGSKTELRNTTRSILTF